MTNDAAPAWLQPLVSVTTQIGVPTVFAGVLLWFVLTNLGETLKTIEQNEIARTAMLQEIQKEFINAIQDQTTRFEQAIQKNIEVNKELSK